MEIESRKQNAIMIQGDNGKEIQVLNDKILEKTKEQMPIGLYKAEDGDQERIRKLALYINQENAKKMAIQKKLHKIGEKFVIELKYLV